MRRALVVTDESARHRFRASQPPHLRAIAVTLRGPRWWLPSAQDIRDFLMAYCACFIAVTAFIS